MLKNYITHCKFMLANAFYNVNKYNFIVKSNIYSCYLIKTE